MRSHPVNPSPPSPKARRAANVSVPADLLREAKSLGINLSRVLEKGLEEEVRAARRERWLEENREAIEEYNKRVAKQGTFGDRMRRF
jgi:antitoxin CcdA